jgi:hypothetical protein
VQRDLDRRNSAPTEVPWRADPDRALSLNPNKPAIGKGIKVNYAGTNTPVTTDQHGFRLDTPNPNIGAFQVQSG